MADGRQLVYFDDREPYASGAATRRLRDRRELPPLTASPTMRFDVLTGEWVVLASHRMDRTHLPPVDSCPLCPAGLSGALGEVPAEDYDVVTFTNRFPSYTGAATSAAKVPTTHLDGQHLWPTRPAVGRCEVVCFSSDHSASLADLGPRRMRTVIDAWADRTTELSALEGVAEVFAFENRGREIGVTLEHPHGQIYACSTLTPRTSALIRQAQLHAAATGGNLLADVLDAERAAGTRLVHSGEHWSAYVPAAARWPVEYHLAPHRDIPDLSALHDAEREELAALYPELLGRLDRYFEGVEHLPYIASWHQAPVGAGRDLGRLYLQVFSVMRSAGRLKYLAGSESAMGAWINDASPEHIANRLRELVKPRV